MALKPCRECGAQVSTKAEVCPHCGVHSPTSENPLTALGVEKGKKRTGGPFFAIAVIVVLCVLAVMYAESPDTKCSSDWTKCADNEQLVKKYSRWTDVQFECKQEADKQAKYKTEWSSIPFDTFLKGNQYVTSGTAIAIEPDAQFQNGFGAMVRSRVTCTYDLKAQRVINVEIAPR